MADPTESRQVTALMSKSAETASDLMKGVKVLADVLAEQMEIIHGGSWSVDINHDAQFVAICQNDFGRGRIAAPKRGVAI